MQSRARRSFPGWVAGGAYVGGQRGAGDGCCPGSDFSGLGGTDLAEKGGNSAGEWDVAGVGCCLA